MMKKLIFSHSECVKIETKDQYNEICHLLRNPERINHELKRPIYLEHANSATRGRSIGIIHEPISTWTRQRLKIKSFEIATNY